MTATETYAIDAWLCTSEADPSDVWQATLDELDRLFETDLGARSWPGGRASADLAREAGAALDALGHGRALSDLLALLAPRRDGTAAEGVGERIVLALAEILWVPRGERTEYRGRPAGSAPPWDIRRLLLEYAVWSHRIDALLGALTKGFCAAHCDRLPAGCCTIEGYDMGVVPPLMLEAQRLEARWRGWAPPGLRRRCDYHGPSGCCLVLFKSPACAGMLCEGLIGNLRHRFAEPALEAFLRPLARYRNNGIDRARVFELMRETDLAGRRLLGD